jgi:flavin-dependent thymidylate synthase
MVRLHRRCIFGVAGVRRHHLEPGAPLCRRWRKSCTRRCRCSTTALSGSSTTWATTARSCRRRASRTGAAPGGSARTAGLINYLMRHRHTTPFEMCEIKYHVKLPIFVARQWIRHRTANVNEYSARYSILDNEFYIPAPEHLAAQSAANRQGRDQSLEGEAARRVLDLLRDDSERAYAGYAGCSTRTRPARRSTRPGRAWRASWRG